MAEPGARPPPPPPGFRMGDPAVLSRSMADIAERAQRLVTDWLNRQSQDHSHELPAIDPLNVGSAFMDMTAGLMRDPAKLVQASLGFWQDYMTLWQNSARRMWGMAPVPAAGDRRPKDDASKEGAWKEGEVFGFIKQSYLLSARYVHDMVARAEGLDPRTAQRVDFYSRQFIDAMSPAAFMLANPEVLRRTAETGGENLLRGLTSLLGDLERGRGKMGVRMADRDAQVGGDIGASPGKVVFQNDLMQLIQYAPSTPAALRRPLLIVPPWISKFYVLDLRPKNSFVRWAVSQGHTVFMASWVNPDERTAGKGFDDYMRDGVLAALDAIEQATGEREVNAVGCCLGGTLLAATLAWMAAAGDGRVRSATFFVTMLDFAEAGELGVFINEEQLRLLEERTGKPGLPGGGTDATSDMLRANDLIWSFVVNNYLVGNEPFPLDLLHWNSDSTRMPARLHGFYLRQMYQANLLRVPGGLRLLDQDIDLGGITVPAYFLSTREDHIAPWMSTYRGTQLLGGDTRFVLAASGHIAGVVNPPEGGKHSHWISGIPPDGAAEWLAGATEMAGSWWPDWQRWVAALDAAEVPARVPGSGALPALENAPGSYVKVRAG